MEVKVRTVRYECNISAWYRGDFYPTSPPKNGKKFEFVNGGYYNTISLSRHEQVCLMKQTCSWRVNLLYYEHWTDKQKYFYVNGGYVSETLAKKTKITK